MDRSKSLLPLGIALAAMAALATNCAHQGESSSASAPASSDSIAIPPPPPPSSSPASSAAPPPAPRPTETTQAPSKSGTCGTKMDDWCPSAAGDPCGKYKDAKSCRADPKCKGMRFRGESFVPCDDDGRGFSSNCPTVGCTSQ